MDPSFVHLRQHSEYSLIDGIVRIHDLAKKGVDQCVAAVALTDQTNLFACVKFYKAMMGVGVKPIIGSDLLIKGDKEVIRITVLCESNTGYQQLIQLISKAYTQGQHQGIPYVHYDWLAEHSDGLLILLSRESDLGLALLHDQDTAGVLAFWQSYFADRFYLEIQRIGKPHESRYNQLAVSFAEAHNIPIVATNDVRFLEEDQFEAHEARVCIHDGYLLHDKKRPSRYTAQQYFRSEEEMCALFQDIPQALENTVRIAKRCNVHLRLGENFLPNFPVPEGMTTAEYLVQLSKERLESYLPRLLDVNAKDFKTQRKEYDERLEIELKVINAMGFPGYFLIVADFIQWAKNNDVPVGPGRGSGAGSLVAYVLGITDLDPLAYDLLFERFLNPERVSMPDFDVDFCMDGRDRVIEYVAEKYGRESVSQIITFGSMAAKAVVRDVGRVLGHGYGFVDKIAKLIPFEIGMTLQKAIETEDLLRDRYRREEEVTNLIDLAMQLEGISRNAGKHAGGVVISPSLLTDFTALYCEEGGKNLVTQLDKDDVESIGLVKFDFLGLRTLTIIKWALKMINSRLQSQGKPPVDLQSIPMDDVKTFQLLKKCQTSAVFQLESRGMKELVNRLQPDHFEEIIALVALFRPGPLQSGMVDDFIDRKHGRSKVEYPHPELEPILSPTYGVILYQEQVMQIAQVLGGYTLGGADILRRAMGKKKPEEMAKQRKIFVKGALKKKVNKETAEGIFDLMEKFAGYGFNKSHSAAYALIAYQTAYLKAHYPEAFMAAVLSSDMDNTDKVVFMIEECDEMKLPVQYPKVNRCQYAFAVNDKNEIIYGLGAIKGVGQAAIDHVIEEREANGAYKDLFDFYRRVDSQKINKRVLEAFIKSGAMDDFHPEGFRGRSALFASIPTAAQAADQLNRNRAQNQHDLFGASQSEEESFGEYESAAEWPEQLRLRYEKDVLGLYVSGHPLDEFQEELSHVVSGTLGNLSLGGKKSVRVAGLIKAIRTMFTKRGDKMAFIRLEDNTGALEVAVFSDIYAKSRDLVVKDQILVIEGEVTHDDYTGGFRVSAKRISTIEEARETYAKHVALLVDPERFDKPFIAKLSAVLSQHKGGCPVKIHYRNQAAKGNMSLGPQWRVNPSDALITELNNLFTEQSVKILYD